MYIHTDIVCIYIYEYMVLSRLISYSMFKLQNHTKNHEAIVPVCRWKLRTGVRPATHMPQNDTSRVLLASSSVLPLAPSGVRVARAGWILEEKRK